jgi:hypothetical protein
MCYFISAGAVRDDGARPALASLGIRRIRISAATIPPTRGTRATFFEQAKDDAAFERVLKDPS